MEFCPSRKWIPPAWRYRNIPGGTLFERMPIHVALLAPHPEVRLVLCTSWTRARSFNFSQKQLSPTQQERVIGATFRRRFMRLEDFFWMPRGAQIAKDVFPRRPGAWVALDGDSLGGSEGWCNNRIQTCGATGIRDTAVQHAIRIRLAVGDVVYSSQLPSTAKPLAWHIRQTNNASVYRPRPARWVGAVALFWLGFICLPRFPCSWSYWRFVPAVPLLAFFAFELLSWGDSLAITGIS
jgi:hypothetical protein